MPSMTHLPPSSLLPQVDEITPPLGPLCHSRQRDPGLRNQAQLQSVDNQESVFLLGFPTWKGTDLKIKC